MECIKPPAPKVDKCSWNKQKLRWYEASIQIWDMETMPYGCGVMSILEYLGYDVAAIH